MRKCVSCGSLLLGEVSVCGRCGTTPLTASIAAPDAASAGTPAPAPGPTQAPSYGRLSIPSPAGAPAGIGVAPASVPTPPAPPFQETWQPVTMPEAVAPPRATRLGLIALALAVVVVGALLVTHLRSDPLPAGTSAFVSGGGYTRAGSTTRSTRP